MEEDRKAKIHLRRSPILTLLEQQGPTSRRNIIREFPNRAKHQIDNDLNALKKSGHIRLRKVKLEKSPRKAYVYFSPSSSPESVADAVQGVHDSVNHVVEPTIGKTAQFYVRNVTIEAKRIGARFGSIPTETKRGSDGEQKLGYITLLPNERGEQQFADFTTTYTIPKEKPFKLLFQIRNRFDEFQLTHAHELVRQALRNEMQPVVIATKISDAAKTFCEEYGIVMHELKRQLLPWEIQAQTKRLKLYSLNAIKRFQFVTDQPFRLRKGRSKPIDPLSLHDLEVMSEPSWIESPRRTWVSRLEELKAEFLPERDAQP